MKFAGTSCDATQAHSAFLRLPSGCNPTPSGRGTDDTAWYARCDGADWAISWFDGGLTCDGSPDRTEGLLTPTGCGLNDKQEYERFFCVGSTLPDALDPRAGAATHFRILGALFSDSTCRDDAFFMYLYRAPEVCIPFADGRSERMTIVSETEVALTSYPGTGCVEGAAETRIDVGSCIPFGPNAWIRVLSAKP